MQKYLSHDLLQHGGSFHYGLIGVAASIPEDSWIPDGNTGDWLEKKVDKKIIVYISSKIENLHSMDK